MTFRLLYGGAGIGRVLGMLACVCFALGLASAAFAESPCAVVVVAASNSPDDVKKKADLVCDGKNDEIELLKSITRAKLFDVAFDISPGAQAIAHCYSRHSVTWMPGDYYLDSTLVIPDAADCVINAQGTNFHYSGDTGDAVTVTGAYRCRYNFGTIFIHSSGAALRIRPTKKLYAGMSFFTFTGLNGKDQKGTGLCIDASESNVCVNKFEGTDILGFDKGVFVSDAPASGATLSVPGKIDTNWFWFVYIRGCNTCVQESTNGVDSGVWNVNVDATIPGSVALRIGGGLGKWFVHMGVWGGGKAIIMEPGAGYNLIEMPLPLELSTKFIEDNSGNDTNILQLAGKFVKMPKLPS